LAKHLFISFVHFQIGLLFLLLLICKSYLCILNLSKSLVRYVVWTCFSPFYGVSFRFLIASLKNKTFLFWWSSVYLFFPLLLAFLISHLRKLCLSQGYKGCCCYVFFRVLVLLIRTVFYLN
jgi:hypothetical protein